MGQAIAVRTDYTATEIRLLAKQVKDAAQARRLLAIAAVLDGSSRTEAATNAGMDRQTRLITTKDAHLGLNLFLALGIRATPQFCLEKFHAR